VLGERIDPRQGGGRGHCPPAGRDLGLGCDPGPVWAPLGRRVTTEGPAVAFDESIAGYGLLEADSLDAAIDVAARIPAVWMGGAVEVRPVAA
jgi:hypothetical protein